jgi:hypothetical protein
VLRHCLYSKQTSFFLRQTSLCEFFIIAICSVSVLILSAHVSIFGTPDISWYYGVFLESK